MHEIYIYIYESFVNCHDYYNYFKLYLHMSDREQSVDFANMYSLHIFYSPKGNEAKMVSNHFKTTK